MNENVPHLNWSIENQIIIILNELQIIYFFVNSGINVRIKLDSCKTLWSVFSSCWFKIQISFICRFRKLSLDPNTTSSSIILCFHISNTKKFKRIISFIYFQLSTFPLRSWPSSKTRVTMTGQCYVINHYLVTNWLLYAVSCVRGSNRWPSINKIEKETPSNPSLGKQL